MLNAQQTMNRAIAIFISIILAISFAPIPAYATNTSVNVSDAQKAFDNAEDALAYAQMRLDEISDEFNALSEEIEELQEEIDVLATQVLESQQAMLDGRSLISSTAIYQYREGTFSTFLNVLLGSSDLNELARNMDYVSQIMTQQSEEIEIQKQLREEFSSASDMLTEQKNEQEEKLAEINQKREEAVSVVEQAASVAQEKSTELESLKKQADQFVWQNKQGTKIPEPEKPATTTDRTDVVSPNTPVIPSTSTLTGEGWRTGVASAYGGSSDAGTPNPGITANGTICNDYSMGVAIPMAWGNDEWQRLRGRTVEICYNGMTVYGTVEDRGGMGGGSRALDLQPGIFKAFGYNDCYSWGLRTVSYRFL